MNRESCKNCGGVIGSLQQPYVWKEQVVCGRCYYNLANEPQAPTPVTKAIPYASPSAMAPLGKGDIICPNVNCGYVGPPDKQPKGSAFVAILLLFFAVIPGLIYMVVYSGHNIVCPNCGLKIRDA